MATFLQLVQDVARQSGTLAGGQSIASVAGVSGRADKIVDWVKKAWVDIQNQRDQWAWMRAEFSSTLAIGTKRYTGASFNLTRHARWVVDTPEFQPLTIYDSTLGQADEGAITFIPFNAWRTRYDRGTHDNTRPNVYAVSHANELCFGPTPDLAYAVRGEYVKTPQVLAANTDEPEMPSRFHDLIVWRAMQFLAAGDESVATNQFVSPEHARLFRILCEEQLPGVSLADNALA